MESIKTDTLAILPIATVEGDKYKINVGSNEVIALKALNIEVWGQGLIAGANVITVGLYRKSDKFPASDDDVDIIWSFTWRIRFVTESIDISYNDMIHFPQPLYLIRPPRLIHSSSGFIAPEIVVKLYYMIKVLPDVDMTKLRMKDHD